MNLNTRESTPEAGLCVTSEITSPPDPSPDPGGGGQTRKVPVYRRRWFLVGVVVPIVGAIIAAVPLTIVALRSEGGEADGPEPKPPALTTSDPEPPVTRPAVQRSRLPVDS